MSRVLFILCWLLVGTPAWPDAGRAKLSVHSAKAFDAWLQSDDGKRRDLGAEYKAFVDFLAKNDVRDVVPPWQLLRTDADYAARCDLPAFAMPPRSHWPAIVPALKLVEAEIKPLVGKVDVHSAWRSPELNRCVKGAKGSRHLTFSALDLIAPERNNRVGLFKQLCALHRRVGPRTSMGLGAYYDPAKPKANLQGRFHIDAKGYRQWGFDYTAASSGCRHLA